MAAIQNLGAWGAICFWSFQFAFGPWEVSEEQLPLPRRSVWGYLPPLAVTFSARWELSPGPQSHSDLLQREAPASCYAASGISPSPSPDVLHEAQDSRAALSLCPLKARRMKVCAEDMRHFWLSRATIMTYRYADKHTDWNLVVCALKETIFSKHILFLDLTLVCSFKNLTFFDGLFHSQILAGCSLRYARSMMR